VSGTYGHERGTSSSTELPTYKSTGQASIFSYVSNSSDATKTAVAFGPHSRISPQGYYFWGPFGLLAEYVSSTQRASLGTKSGSFTNAAWQVATVYALTGESESYDGITPTQVFDPWEGTWGAVEFVARYGVLDIDGDAFGRGFADSKKSARRATEWVVGANWHLNKNVKLVLDYANTDFRGGASKGDRRSERAILSRVQLSY
jgi:phosphate-selective porin OprO/OprP